MNRIAHAVSLSALLLALGCNREGARSDVRPAPTLSSIEWSDAQVEDDPAQAVPSATSFARKGSSLAVDGIWERLSTHRGTFLRHWRQSFETRETPDPSDVVAALDELVLAVTGASGFWRKTVAQSWLGCDANEESEPCRRFASLELELASADALQRQLQEVEPRQAARFLERNQARIVAYIDTYVPKAPSAAALRSNPLYRKHLASLLDGPFAPTSLSKRDL